MKMISKWKNYIIKNLSKDFCKSLDKRIETFVNVPNYNKTIQDDFNTLMDKDNILKILYKDGIIDVSCQNDTYAMFNYEVVSLYKINITITNYGKFRYKNGGYVAVCDNNWHFIKLYTIPAIISFFVSIIINMYFKK